MKTEQQSCWEKGTIDLNMEIIKRTGVWYCSVFYEVHFKRRDGWNISDALLNFTVHTCTQLGVWHTAVSSLYLVFMLRVIRWCIRPSSGSQQVVCLVLSTRMISIVFSLKWTYFHSQLSLARQQQFCRPDNNHILFPSSSLLFYGEREREREIFSWLIFNCNAHKVKCNH